MHPVNCTESGEIQKFSFFHKFWAHSIKQMMHRFYSWVGRTCVHAVPLNFVRNPLGCASWVQTIQRYLVYTIPTDLRNLCIIWLIMNERYKWQHVSLECERYKATIHLWNVQQKLWSKRYNKTTSCEIYNQIFVGLVIQQNNFLWKIQLNYFGWKIHGNILN